MRCLYAKTHSFCLLIYRRADVSLLIPVYDYLMLRHSIIGSGGMSEWTAPVSFAYTSVETLLLTRCVASIWFVYVCVWASDSLSTAPTSAPHSQQRQMDPQETAREKIKNNSCQISEWSEREEKEEEEERGGEKKSLWIHTVAPRPGRAGLTFSERLIRKFHGSREVIILKLSAANSMSKCHPGISPSRWLMCCCNEH